MGICIENKSSLKENLTYLLPSVRAKLLITVCLEIPCTIKIAKQYEISKLISVSILIGVAVPAYTGYLKANCNK